MAEECDVGREGKRREGPRMYGSYVSLQGIWALAHVHWGARNWLCTGT